jgi:hypothetical protein
MWVRQGRWGVMGERSLLGHRAGNAFLVWGKLGVAGELSARGLMACLKASDGQQHSKDNRTIPAKARQAGLEACHRLPPAGVYT